jgi:hypothetical protein
MFALFDHGIYYYTEVHFFDDRRGGMGRPRLMWPAGDPSDCALAVEWGAKAYFRVVNMHEEAVVVPVRDVGGVSLNAIPDEGTSTGSNGCDVSRDNRRGPTTSSIHECDRNESRDYE